MAIPTSTDLTAWINAQTDDAAQKQLCIDACVQHIEKCNYRLPETYSADILVAVYMMASRLWSRRAGANGISEFGTGWVPKMDPDVEVLLAPYRTYPIAV